MVLSHVDLSDDIHRIYVVDELYGAVDDLPSIDACINEDIHMRPTRGAVVLHAGGYIDKGGRFSDVLQHVGRRETSFALPTVYLLGAHEWLMLRAVDGDPRAALEWLLSGAEATLDQWAVAPRGWMENLSSAIPKHHLDFFRALPASAAARGTRFVCSTFVDRPARPFGLFGRPISLDMPFDGQMVTAVGRSSAVGKGSVPLPWTARELWSEAAARCRVLELDGGRP